MNWNTISRRRSELMGFAMLIIILFHVALPRADAFFGLKRTGNLGVDIFFFLSGMGLWFAWSKACERTPDISFGRRYWQFLRRRLIRIYPAWLIMASLYYIPDYLHGGGHSQSIPDLLGDILFNWGFWHHDELTFWYIPAILAFYLIAPFYMQLIRRCEAYRWLPLVAVVWCVMVQWVTPVHQSVGHIEIFWSRVPIFLIGVNCGEWIRSSRQHDARAWGMVMLLLLLPLLASLHMEQYHHGRYPLFVNRMLYIPLTVSTCIFLAHLLERVPAWICRPLAFVGTISLEMYLIHANFVLHWLTPHHLGYWPTALLCIAITLPLAWLLHKTLEPIIEKL